MKKVALITISCAAIIAVVIFSMNYFTLSRPVGAKLSGDSRNEGIAASVHYKNYVRTNILVFNLTKVENGESRADVFRTLLQAAEALKDKKFEVVELQYKGTTKFILSGEYFAEIGNDYDTQNPMYTVRTFPEHLKTLDGKHAYRPHYGGLLDVVTEQMNDFNNFSDKWYGE